LLEAGAAATSVGPGATTPSGGVSRPDGADAAPPPAKQKATRANEFKGARRAKPTTHNRVDAHIGGRLRIRRKLVGLSQETLAALVGLTVQQIQKHERGRSRIDPTRLFEIGQALGVDIDYFYEEMALSTAEDGGYEPASTTPVAEPRPEVVDLVHTILFGILARPATIDLIRSYGRIADPRLRRKVFDVIDDREPEEV
jgi:transcriptional regulator with XRE-family HTH domain